MGYMCYSILIAKIFPLVLERIYYIILDLAGATDLTSCFKDGKCLTDQTNDVKSVATPINPMTSPQPS